MNIKQLTRVVEILSDDNRVGNIRLDLKDLFPKWNAEVTIDVNVGYTNYTLKLIHNDNLVGNDTFIKYDNLTGSIECFTKVNERKMFIV